MDDSAPPPAETSPSATVDVASLMTGIIEDFRVLVVQQIRLTRQEILANLQLRRTGTAIVGAGAGTGSLAALLLCLSLVHGLHWLVSPAGSDPGWLPLSACYAIVGTSLAAISGGLVHFGRVHLRSCPPWQNVSDELIQEIAPWTTTSQPSAAR